MAKLIYTAITSLDGYIEDEHGSFDWSAPDEDVHAFVNDLERRIGTYLYGRRLYETMVYWETAPADSPAVELNYARVWRSAAKIVYSTTLQETASARTRIERTFDAAAVRAMKEAANADLGVGGAELAAHDDRVEQQPDLVDEPGAKPVGGGKRALPDGVRLDLELLDERRFASGVVYLRYATR